MKSRLQEIIDETEIIDAHGHVGDITRFGGGLVVYERGLRVGHRYFDTAKVLNLLKYKSGKKLTEPNRLLKAMATWSGKQRIAGASLENMREALDQSGIKGVCCLPVPPYVSFEDVRKASTAEDRIIPFTGVDFSDMKNLAAKLSEDVKNGAKGLKIHPILQKVSPTDDEVHEVLDEWEQYDLPILIHTGVTSYHLDKEGRGREKPEFGRMELIKKMVEDTKSKARIILGHAGIFQFEEALEMGRNKPNVCADTTFQSPGRTEALLNAFGPGRVVYGADWPYGDITPAIKRTVEAMDQARYKREEIAQVLGGNIKDLMHLE